MSTANDNAAAPLFIELRPGMRKALADAVDAFLNLLDQIDADADLEDADAPEDDAPCEDVGDDEPSLGAPGASSFPPQTLWALGAADDDREVEDEHDEPAATTSRRSARRWPSISSTPGGRMRTPGAHVTKLSLRSAGQATATAIPRWRCAATTTIASTMTSARKITTSRRITADDRRDQR